MKDDPNFTRRHFLHRLGGGLAAASIGSLPLVYPRVAQAAQRAVAPGQKLGWAIVGLGSYATRQILPRMHECEHSQVVALVSGSPEKARTIADEYDVAHSNIYNYENYDSIADNPAIDIVYVVLPNSMHHEYTIRALRAGKHVLCEKPMSVSVAEAEEMVAVARETGRKLMIGYRSRFEPYNQLAIEMSRGGALGATKVIETSSGFNIGDPEQWRLKLALSGGGSMMDIGIYSVQAARYLTGEEPVEVNALEHTPAGDPRFREVEDTVLFQLRFPSGVLANCVSAYTSNHNRYRVVGTNGWLELEPATGYSGHAMRVAVRGPAEPRVLPEPAKNQFVGMLDHLSESVINDTDPLVGGEEGLQDMRVIAAVYEAARTGRTVRVAS